jgi:RsiW-degrading membrane proteinase PrsW (M82 family)
MNWITILFGAFFIPIFLLYCYQRGQQKKAGFIKVLLIMLFCTPFIGYWIVEALPNHKMPCTWCGNKNNEAEYCGLCGKNQMGELKSDFLKK